MYKIVAIILALSALIGYSGYLFLDSPLKSQQAEESYNVLLIGDQGTSTVDQHEVANKMNEVGENHQSKYIFSFGDNFYPTGVSGLDDPLWQTGFEDVYPKQSYLKDLPWHGVLGNHDYYGTGMFSEFEYKKNNWRIDDFFWTHTDKVGGKSIAYIHIDTSFLAYGPLGSRPQMGMYFKELGWQNDDDVLGQIEEQLIEYQDYDWIIVMGHHHIGYACFNEYHTDKIYKLLQKYRVDAYLCGHSHTLAFTIQDDMGLVVSGAGGWSRQNECAPSNPYWSIGLVFGFMDMQIYEDRLEIEAHYIRNDYQTNPERHWVDLKMPPIYRRTNKQVQKEQI